METVHGFDFFPLDFDGDGRLVSTDAWTEFKKRASANRATDAIFMAHGFRNDEGEARALYTEILKNVRSHIEQRNELKPLAGRTYVVAGVFWPSKAFKESFGEESGGGVRSAGEETSEREEVRLQLCDLQETLESSADKKKIEEAIKLLDGLENHKENQDRFVDLVLSIVHEKHSDPTEGLKEVKAKEGSELLARLGGPIIVPTEGHDELEGGAAGFAGAGFGAGAEGEAQGVRSFFGSIFGKAGQFLNLTTWYLMKERSGTVGANGVAACVRELKKAQSIKVHLVGHSLGGRLMAACAKSLAQPPKVTVDSLTLLQAAFSHFGLSADNGDGDPGFFRDVIDKEVVSGPMVATFSFQDEVVGKAYAIASRLAQDNTRAIGGPDDPFGGIGRNGAQEMTAAEFASEKLHTAGTGYTFRPRILHCLDGSGGLIKNHGDVRNPDITYAFASAMSRT